MPLIDFNIDDTQKSLEALWRRLGDDPQDSTAIDIDLTDCQYLGPLAIATLAALIVKRNALEWRTTVRPPTQHSLAGYCVFSGFAQLAWNGPPPETHPSNETIPIRIFSKNDNDGARLLCQLVSEHIDISKHLAQVLQTILGELTQNVQDHAEGPGVLAARFIKGQGKIRFCIADSGVGLRKSLSKSMTVQSDHHAVSLAMEKGRTSKSQGYNMGLGLELLDSIVKSNGGRMLLASGTAYYERNANWCDIREFAHPVSIPGTVCFVEFVVDNTLYPESESDTDVWG